MLRMGISNTYHSFVHLSVCLFHGVSHMRVFSIALFLAELSAINNTSPQVPTGSDDEISLQLECEL